MFEQLPESKPKKQRSLGSTVISAVLHSILIAAVIVATANAGLKKDDKAKAEEVKFVEAP